MSKSVKEKYLEKLRGVIWRKHYSPKTERAYMAYVGKFWDAARRCPEDWSREQRLEQWLTDMAKSGCSASTQNVAFNAVVFFFKEVVREPLKGVKALRAKRPVNLRVAPDKETTLRLLDRVPDVSGYPTWLIARLIYACGLRVNEPLNLRLKDVDLVHSRLAIWDSKGGNSRFVALPCCLAGEIKQQMRYAVAMWERDRIRGIPVPLPHLVRRKYRASGFSRGWYWLFPLHTPTFWKRTGETLRWHALDKSVQRAVKVAAKELGLEGQVTPHHLRHAYGTHTMDAGANIRDVQEALGHKSVETTQGYVYGNGLRVVSPLEGVEAR